MTLNRYPIFTTSDYHDFEFSSTGPKGNIKKIIRFSKINNDPITYNLGFGDLDEKLGLVNDLLVTDNKDRDKILATVAYAVIVFCNVVGKNFIYAEGSTLSRTRLYQMGIASMWSEIDSRFHVFGAKGISWERFRSGTNYDAFLVKMK